VLVSIKRLMYRTYRHILVQRKFRYSEGAKRGLNEAAEREKSHTINNNKFRLHRCKLRGKNTNTMKTVVRNSHQLTFCSVVLILPLIGNLFVNKCVKQYRLYAAVHMMTFVKHSVEFLDLHQSR